jgi:hypothetical protein
MQTTSDPFFSFFALPESATTAAVSGPPNNIASLSLMLGIIDVRYLEQQPAYGRPKGVVPSTTATHSSRLNPLFALLQPSPQPLYDADDDD